MSVCVNFEDLQKKFNKALTVNIAHASISEKKLTSLIQNNPEYFLKLIEENVASFEKMSQELHRQVFFHACNMLKEIDSKLKFVGLRILHMMTDIIREDFLINAYVFEKKSYRAFQQNPKKKFVSIGDYELLKFDETSGVNFGFFASALEEENKGVKINTLRLIGILGKKEKFKQFAEQSIKYIVELINDEEDEVRFTTIETLKVLISNFKILDLGSREIIFFNLKEKHPKLRGLIYELVSCINYSKLEDFQKGIKKLNENLRLFPEDKLNIYKCIKNSSKYNSSLISVHYINKILNFDPNYYTPESNWEDRTYVSNLVILQEFIWHNKNRQGLFVPKSLMKHYSYLCEKYPAVFFYETCHSLLSKYDPRLNLLKSCNNRIYPQRKLPHVISMDDISGNLTSSRDLEVLYQNIFSFLNCLHSESNHSLILPLTSKIIQTLDKINFLIHMSNHLNEEILNFNNSLSMYVLNEFHLKYGFSNKLKEMRLKDGLNTIGDLVTNIKLNEIKVTSPKNGFNYIHSKSDRNYPFFLQITMKLAKFSNEEEKEFDFRVYLIKNLFIHLEHFGSINRINLEYSNIHEQDGSIIIKHKFPVYIQETNEEYRLTLKIKSEYGKSFRNTVEDMGIMHSDNCNHAKLVDDIIFNITY